MSTGFQSKKEEIVKEIVREKLDEVVKTTFFQKYQQYIYGGVLLSAGLLGGNMDRIKLLVPEIFPTKRIEALEKDVQDIKLHLKIETIKEEIVLPDLTKVE